MKLSHEIQNNVFILSVEGNFEMYSIKEFEDYISVNAPSSGIVKIGIDMAQTNSIDSSGIGSLIRMGKKLKSQNIGLAIKDPSPRILNLLVTAGLQEFYKIYSAKQFKEKFVAKKVHKGPGLIQKLMKLDFLSILYKKSSIKISMALLLLVAIFITEYLQNKSQKAGVAELSVFLKGYLWEMDDRNAKDFASILLQSKGYSLLQITHSDGSEFIKTQTEESFSKLDKLLRPVKLVREVEFRNAVHHNKEVIGELTVHWINKNIYIHLVMSFIFFLLYTIVSSYIKIIQNRKELAAKNIEINEKMEEVQMLKVQQDGDYFLISLLTKPLSNIMVKSHAFRIEKLVKQKKRFEFKKRIDEIGGDICLADRIILRGRSYLVFVNADAMGKSLQGAGGVLVFGSAINSLITRNKNSITAQEYFPEQWLKSNFIDLHKVFETFSGSMLMSMIIGLIDEEVGFMYWMNAEHPGLILYRDNKAEFLDTDDIFMKLGTEGVEKELSVKSFQFQPGDCIFMGSDGKDDISIGKDASGFAIINDDETQFLKRVEESKGELNSIYEGLKKFGELADDLSIMKINYLITDEDKSLDKRLTSYLVQSKKFILDKQTEEAKKLLLKALGEYQNSHDVMKLLIKIYIKESDFESASKYIERYIELKPDDEYMIYIASYTFKKLKNYKKGIAYGERYRIRIPSDTKNLFNLYDLYFKDENYEKAHSVLDKILKIEPSNEQALALKGGELPDDF